MSDDSEDDILSDESWSTEEKKIKDQIDAWDFADYSQDDFRGNDAELNAEERIDGFHYGDGPNLMDASYFEDSTWEELPPNLFFRNDPHFVYFVHSGPYPYEPRENFVEIGANETWEYEPWNIDGDYQYLLISKTNSPGQSHSKWMRLRLPNINNTAIALIKSGESRRRISRFLNIVKSEVQQSDVSDWLRGTTEYLKWKLNDLIQNDLDLKAQEIVNMRLWLELTFGNPPQNTNLTEVLPPYHLRRHLKEGREIDHPFFIDDQWQGKPSKFIEWLRDNQSSFHEISVLGDYENVCRVHNVKISRSQIAEIIRKTSKKPFANK